MCDAMRCVKANDLRQSVVLSQVIAGAAISDFDLYRSDMVAARADSSLVQLVPTLDDVHFAQRGGAQAGGRAARAGECHVRPYSR